MTAAAPTVDAQSAAARSASAPSVQHDLRLVLPAALAWAVAAWAVPRPAPLLGRCAAVLAVAALLALGVAFRSGRRAASRAGAPGLTSGDTVTGGRAGLPAAAALAAAVLAAVLAVSAGASARRDAEPLRTWTGRGLVAVVEGTATSDASAVRPGPFPGPPRYVVRVAARTVDAHGRRVTAPAPLVVLGGPAWSAVSAGSRVTLTGRLGVPRRPGTVAAEVDAIGPPVTSPGGPLWRAADHVRAGLRRACAGLPPDPRGLLPALVVGDTTNLPAGLVDDLRTAGLTHLTAVSGANVAVVVACTVWAVSAAGAHRRARVWLGLAAVAGFVVLARPQPSVLRAAVMGSIALVAVARARRARGLPLLSAAVLVLLVASPALSRAPGFALSVAATGALVVLVPPWTARLERRLPRPVALAVAVPAAAQAVCGPIVVLLNPAVSTTAVPANLLAGPAVAPATVLGVVAALVAVVSPALAAAPAWLGGLATWWVAVVAHRAAALPGASLPWPEGRRGAALLAVLTALLVALSLRVRPADGGEAAERDATAGRRRTAGRGRATEPGRATGRGGPRRTGDGGTDAGRASPATALVAAGVVVALALGWLAGPRLAGRWGDGGPGEWAVAMCDVGQGDMLVARSGEHAAVVVDTGPEPVLADRCLRKLAVTQVDLLVLTHFHADHVGGLAGVLRGRTVAAAVVSRLPEPAENVLETTTLLADRAVPVATAEAGTTGFVGSGRRSVAWHVLRAEGPGPDAFTAVAVPGGGGDEGPDGTVVNESSVATELVVTGPGGALRVLGLGDLEADGQAGLLRELRDGSLPLGGPVDVVKVAHHGSAVQDPTLYQWVRAPVALVGVGVDNDYGHPASKTLDLLATTGAVVHRTDREGTVLLVPGRSRAPPGVSGRVRTDRRRPPSRPRPGCRRGRRRSRAASR